MSFKHQEYFKIFPGDDEQPAPNVRFSYFFSVILVCDLIWGDPGCQGRKLSISILFFKKKKAAQDPANQGRGQEDSSSRVSEVSSRAGSREANRVWSSHRCPGAGIPELGRWEPAQSRSGVRADLE